MHLYVVIDNRLLPQATFLEEATFSSFQKLTCELLCKLLHKSTNHTWLAAPKQVYYAGPGSVCTSTACFVADLPRIPDLLEPRYTSNVGTFAANQTWKVFFLDALRKIKKHVEQASSNGTGTAVVIVFYSTDLALFGQRGSASIIDGLHYFFEITEEIKESLPSLTIRLVSGMTSSNENELHSNHLQFLAESNRFTWITLETVVPTKMQFDEELKALMSLMATKLTVKLLLPLQDEAECFIHLKLTAHSLPGADCLMHLKNLEVCGACSRDKINPLHLSGYGVEVSCPMSFSDHLPQHTVEANYTLCLGLVRWMSEHDTVLIVRVSFTPAGQTMSCAKFWALIPPVNAASTANMALVMLLDRDQMLLPSSSATEDGQQWSLDEDLLEELFAALNSSGLALQHKRKEARAYNPWLHLGGWAEYEFDQFRRRNQSIMNLHPIVGPSATGAQSSNARNVPVSLPSPIAAPKAKEKAPTQVRKQTPHVIDLATSEPSSISGAGKRSANPSTRTTQTRSASASSSNVKKPPPNPKGKVSVAEDDDEWFPEDFNPIPKAEPKLLKRKFGDQGSKGLK